jgi:hypothetical protein
MVEEDEEGEEGLARVSPSMAMSMWVPGGAHRRPQVQ